MTASATPDLSALVVERDIRAAIWNGLRASGLNQEFAQIYIRAIMAEPLMSRALSALAANPAPLDMTRAKVPEPKGKK